LGRLAEHLNLLAEQLEQDERDLRNLRQHNTRLTDQVRALAVVEERNRLARELHDSVKQHLFSVAMTSSAVQARIESLPDASDELKEMVREVETAARTAQRETTRLIEDLGPGTLQEQGLAAALNDYTLLFGAREHLLVYLDVQGNDAVLPPAVAEALYRVAQEALHNVARHARATRVDVKLHCLPEQATLTVRDNGVGFDTNEASSGFGLANMQERVLDLGGRLTVESRPSIGTRICAEVGLKRTTRPARELALDAARPDPQVSNWGWLGQKLVIPVGQTWPWLPADETYLRSPLVKAGDEPLYLESDVGLLGLKRDYVLRRTEGGRPILRLHQAISGFEWKDGDVGWTVRRMSSGNGRTVLSRRGQPLAAAQLQGRVLNRWTEIVYDGRGYRLAMDDDYPCAFELQDGTGEILLTVQGCSSPRVELKRPLPLPLLGLVIARLVDELALVTNGPEGEE
jgi:two-component sensor histidine kinase